MGALRRGRLTAFLVAVVAAGLTSGCASSGSIVASSPLARHLSEYDQVTVEVTSEAPEAHKQVVELQNAIIAGIRRIAAFETVVSEAVAPEAGSGVVLKAKIVELDKVSTTARLLWGALAGRAEILVSCELVDASSADSIGTFTAEGISSGGSVAAGTTSQAVELAAETIVNYIRQKLGPY